MALGSLFCQLLLFCLPLLGGGRRLGSERLGTFDFEGYQKCISTPLIDEDGNINPEYASYNGSPCDVKTFAFNPSSKPVGTGASAQVFAAWSVAANMMNGTPADVALKRVDEEKDWDYVRNEVCILRHLSHENTPEFFCVFKPRFNGLVIAMEFIPGIPVSTFLDVDIDALDRDRRQELENIANQWPVVLKAAVSVMSLLHAHNIVIQDIKPENVIVHVDDAGIIGHATIVDFGFTMSLERANQYPEPLGTPLWVPPEYLIETIPKWRRDAFDPGLAEHIDLLRERVAELRGRLSRSELQMIENKVSIQSEWYKLGIVLCIMIRRGNPFRQEILERLPPLGILHGPDLGGLEPSLRELLGGLTTHRVKSRYGRVKVTIWTIDNLRRF